MSALSTANEIVSQTGFVNKEFLFWLMMLDMETVWYLMTASLPEYVLSQST